MELLIVTGAGVLVLAVALGVAASRGRRMGDDAPALLRLARLRSSSGMPFFPTDHAMWELSGELDEVADRPRREDRRNRVSAAP